MGLFKNMNDLYKAGGEPMGKGRHERRTGTFADAKSMMADAQAKMAGAQAMLAEQAKLASLATIGADATATVIAARQTTQQINFQPVIELDLHVSCDGQPPRPVTLRQAVPQLYLGKVQPGATLHAKVDPTDLTVVYLDLATS